MSLSRTMHNGRWITWNRDHPDMDKRLKELAAFVRETNKIEGIHRSPNKREMAAHATLLSKETLTIADLQLFVTAIQPGAVLRSGAGMNVRVGNHRPTPGGEHVVQALDQLLGAIDLGTSAYHVHHIYETLHPFMDGNGRSGRALWLWMMGPSALSLGFLHTFYYQALSNGDGRHVR